MSLTKEQQKKVEDNIGLVHKVIHDKLHAPYQVGSYAYDDLFQIGCIGLCKAVKTDKGGTFSTYAYRLIWHELCDAVIYATRRQIRETACDVIPYITTNSDTSEESSNLRIDLERMLLQTKKEATPTTAKGIDAMRKMAEGYTSGDLSGQLGASDKLVCAWVSKARKFVRAHPEGKKLAESYHVGL